MGLGLTPCATQTNPSTETHLNPTFWKPSALLKAAPRTSFQRPLFHQPHARLLTTGSSFGTLISVTSVAKKPTLERFGESQYKVAMASLTQPYQSDPNESKGRGWGGQNDGQLD